MLDPNAVISPYGGSFERMCHQIANAAEADPGTALDALFILDDNQQPISVASCASQEMLDLVTKFIGSM